MKREVVVVETVLEELSLKRICASSVTTKKVIRFFWPRKRTPQDNPGSATALAAFDEMRYQ